MGEKKDTLKIAADRINGLPLLAAIILQAEISLQVFLRPDKIERVVVEVTDRLSGCLLERFLHPGNDRVSEPRSDIYLSCENDIGDWGKFKAAASAYFSKINPDFHRNSDNHGNTMHKAFDLVSSQAQDAKELHDVKNFVCVRWTLALGGTTAPVTLLMTHDFLESFYESFMPGHEKNDVQILNLKAFFDWIQKQERYIETANVDGIPGLDYNISWLYLGGHTAELKWFFHFSDTFSIPPNEFRIILHEIQTGDLYGNFMMAAIRCLPAATITLKEIMTPVGIEEFVHKVGLLSQEADSDLLWISEFTIMNIVLRLFKAGKIEVKGPLEPLLRKTIEYQYEKPLFSEKAVNRTFIDVFTQLDDRDIQTIAANVSRPILAGAVFPEAAVELIRLLHKLKRNVSGEYWNNLTSDMEEFSENMSRNKVAMKAEILLRRLQIVDAITCLGRKITINADFLPRDRDLLSQNNIKKIETRIAH